MRSQSMILGAMESAVIMAMATLPLKPTTTWLSMEVDSLLLILLPLLRSTRTTCYASMISPKCFVVVGIGCPQKVARPTKSAWPFQYFLKQKAEYPGDSHMAIKRFFQRALLIKTEEIAFTNSVFLFLPTTHFISICAAQSNSRATRSKSIGHEYIHLMARHFERKPC